MRSIICEHEDFWLGSDEVVGSTLLVGDSQVVATKHFLTI
jgi:hypothetical protein